MKKFTKLIFSCAAVAALTAALGTAAMAEEVQLSGDIKGTYNTETGAVTLTDDSYDVGGQQTILIFKGEVTDTVAEGNIEYINQETAITKNIAGLKDGAGAEGTKYVIRIGGDKDGQIGTKGFLESTFVVPGGGVEPEMVVIGNADLDASNTVDAADATVVLRHGSNIQGAELTGKALFAAKVDDDDTADAADATCILRYAASLKDGIGHAGESKPYSE